MTLAIEAEQGKNFLSCLILYIFYLVLLVTDGYSSGVTGDD